MIRSIFILILVPLAFIFSLHTPSEINSIKLLAQMNDSIKKIKTLKVTVSAIERMEGSFLSAESEYKLQTSPRKLYFINPSKKLEILFRENDMNNKALVKPHIFPYFTLSLDPKGNLMRKNQHYTIHELGFDFIARSIALTISKDKDGLRNFIYRGKVNKNGYNCYLIEYENKSFGYYDYVVKEKETVTAIASRLCVNDYLLREKNELINDFGFLKSGRIIKVPGLYCKKAVLYLDDRLLLPVSISLYDDTGIFENYEFKSIEINKGFKEDEFSRHYKDYHF